MMTHWVVGWVWRPANLKRYYWMTSPVYPCGNSCCWESHGCFFMSIHTPALQSSSGTTQAPTVAAWKEELCGILNLFFSIWTFTSPLLRFTSPTPAFDILFLLESFRGLVDFFFLFPMEEFILSEITSFDWLIRYARPPKKQSSTFTRPRDPAQVTKKRM